MAAPVAIRGAREHNLAAVDLDLPRGQLIVLCGVSGSGKSSLAFDTLFVEGQRRYLEALGAGRQRGPGLVPPRVDRIDGLPPTLALPQRASAFGPRSTVGTVTEAAPVLRVLFARAGTQHCPRCGAAIAPVTHDEIVARLAALPDGTRLTLEAPLRLEPGADVAGILEEVQRAGFGRVRLDGEVLRVEDVTPRQRDGAERLSIVVDRIRTGPDRSGRLDDSVRLAVRAGRGVVAAVHGASGEEEVLTFVARPYCPVDDLTLPPLEPALLAPTPSGPGACPRCDGLGAVEGAPCPDCGGSRLSEVARAVRWRGRTLPEVDGMPVEALRAALAVPDPTPVEAAALQDLGRRLDRLLALQLGSSRSAAAWTPCRAARSSASGSPGRSPRRCRACWWCWTSPWPASRRTSWRSWWGCCAIWSPPGTPCWRWSTRRP
ncbi:MAG: hypothetical protein R3F59_07910 [Myxococcota bacterium]